jgi:poly(A) polymerase
VREEKPVTPAFLFAVLLWEPVRRLTEEIKATGEALQPAMQQAASEILSQQLQRVSIPKRFSYPMRDIWGMQHRFEQRGGKRPHRLLAHPRFRAGYDFLLLRAESGEADPELAEWWTRFQEVDEEERNSMTREHKGGGRRRRRRKPRASSSGGNSQ